jgi:pimeloyl-ACP methyl ester carboxylesterase
MEFRYFETNGIRLHAAVDGEQNRKYGTMLFLHGFPEFWYSWRGLLPEFARDYRVVAPDLRGYNLSDKPEGVAAYEVRQLVGDITGLVQVLGGDPVILVAHDWGGAAAWVFAAFHPMLLNKLMILNSPHPAMYTREILTSPEQQQGSQYVLRLRAPDAEEFFSKDNFAKLRKLAFGAFGESALSAADLAAYVEAWSQPGAFTAMLNYYRAMPAVPPDLSKEAPGPRPIAKLPDIRIQVPTLVIWGEKDTALRPGLLDGLDQYVQPLTIHRIPEATHWVHHDQPEEVIAAMRRFLAI